jgi:hypothetical protein
MSSESAPESKSNNFFNFSILYESEKSKKLELISEGKNEFFNKLKGDIESQIKEGNLMFEITVDPVYNLTHLDFEILLELLKNSMFDIKLTKDYDFANCIKFTKKGQIPYSSN